MVRWGIIAPGKIANRFADDMKFVSDSEIVAVASRDIQKAHAFAEKFSIEKAYGSYFDLVKDSDVDVVYIASPHPWHHEHGILCLENGKHVLCEKPIAMNSAQFENMAYCAANNNRFLMEAMWTRFIPSYIKCRELISNGEIGEIKHIQADFSFKAEVDLSKRVYNKELGGGSLLDIGIYPVFIALDLLGIPEQILSSAIISKTGIDQSCSIIFNYPEKKASANLYSSVLNDSPVEAIICGTEGEIKLESRWHHSRKLVVTKNSEIVKELEMEIKGYGYTYEIEEVNHCINNNKKQSEKFSLEQSRRLHQTLDAIRKQIGLRYPADAN